MDDIFKKTIQEITNNHNKIIDDWCKAYLAQLYSEGIEIKPGCFTLYEQEPTFDKETQSMVKKYWFKPGIPKYNDEE